jgi:hypothetical protein
MLIPELEENGADGGEKVMNKYAKQCGSTL